jgi:hypothetical protein
MINRFFSGLKISIFFLPAFFLGASPGCSKANPCRFDPAPDGAAAWLESPRPACPSRTGNGIFGAWDFETPDPLTGGLPIYRYRMDETTDPRASLPVSYGSGYSSDHWHTFGNERITALAHNGGHVEILSAERGTIYLNWFNPASGHLAGGYSAYRVDGGGRRITLGPDRGGQPFAERTFLPYGYRTRSCDGQVCLTRTMFVPEAGAGNPQSTVLLSLIEAESQDGKTHSVALEEPWHVNILPLSFSALPFGPAREATMASRQEHNRDFLLTITSREGGAVLSGVFQNKNPGLDPNAIGPVSNLLPSVFLAWNEPGSGGEEIVYSGDAYDHRQALSLQYSLEVRPGTPAEISSFFGYETPSAETMPVQIKRWRARSGREWLAATRESCAGFMPDLRLASHPELERETAWHGAQLRALSMYEEAFGANVLYQGGVYGLLMGLNGTTRDFAFSSNAMLYLEPLLAREMIRYISRLQRYPDYRIAYATAGFGLTEGAGLHNNPSDLDLSFLWVISEYLLATRDYSILDESIPYYPAGATAPGPVLEHARRSFLHLDREIGYGAHGLLRLGDGDWNDGIILRAADGDRTRAEGESAYNAAMAAYVLPRFAAAIEPADPDLAGRARETASGQSRALNEAWTGEWLLRGYADPETPIGNSELFLEPQPWALLAQVLDEEKSRRLIGNIQKVLDNPSPIGAVLVYPPLPNNSILKEGTAENGGVWFAMNGLLTWAYGLCDPERSLAHQLRSGLSGHAEAYPEIWYGIWSGPDSFNAWNSERPGETFTNIVNSMIDFPVANSNAHAAPLLSAIRGAGILPTPSGWDFIPLWKDRPLMLRLPAVGVAFAGASAAGYINYDLLGTPPDTALSVRLWMPAKARGELRVNGGAAPFDIDSGLARFEVSAGSDGFARFNMK